MDRGACWATVQGCKQLGMIEQAHTHNCIHTHRKGAGVAQKNTWVPSTYILQLVIFWHICFIIVTVCI